MVDVQTSVHDAYLNFWADNDNNSLMGHFYVVIMCLIYLYVHCTYVSILFIWRVLFTHAHTVCLTHLDGLIHLTCGSIYLDSFTRNQIKWRIHTSHPFSLNRMNSEKKIIITKRKCGTHVANAQLWLCVQFKWYCIYITGSSIQFRQMQQYH